MHRRVQYSHFFQPVFQVDFPVDVPARYLSGDIFFGHDSRPWFRCTVRERRGTHERARRRRRPFVWVVCAQHGRQGRERAPRTTVFPPVGRSVVCRGLVEGVTYAAGTRAL